MTGTGQSQLTIAVDGPAASGKGTISRHLADRYGLAYLDTGKLYRAVGALVLQGHAPEDAAQTLDPALLDDPVLRSPQVAKAASEVAAMPAVRAALLAFQRQFAVADNGAVLDGRDIGTVICPDAPVKLFVTAAPEIRAARRLSELQKAGHDTDFETVLEDIRARDARDSGRADAPLKAAADSVLLDTSDLDVAAALQAATDRVEARLAERGI